MDVLAVILFGALIFMILNLKASFSKKMEDLLHELRQIKQQLAKTVIEPSSTEKAIETKVAVSTAAPPTTIIPPKNEATTPKERWQSSFVKMEEAAENNARQEEPAAGTMENAVAENVVKPEAIKKEIPKQVVRPYIPPPPQPGFFERHPDLEKFIGENLINKIGIAILVLAIGFFVKYAIDQDWIGPAGRVAIGILCGAILIGFAHRMHKNYKAFSSVLVGGGLAIFYFTIALAYHQFHLFSQPISFAILVVITGFAVVLSLLYNRQELAIISLLGGFATPFLVSNGSGDYKTLFSYLLILNIGLLIIAYKKAWRLLNILCFACTVILFAPWLISLGDNTSFITYRNGLLFAVAFYLLFFAINIANNIKENKKFIASDFAILLVNTSLFFAAGLYLITLMHAEIYRGLFTASMGLFNLAVTYVLFRKQKIDQNILYLLIGLTLSFISLTAPIQLHGHNITLFWASESVLLYWLYQRSQIKMIAFSSLIVWFAMVFSLLMDWNNIYAAVDTEMRIILNKGFITGLYAAIASYLLFVLKRKPNSLHAPDWMVANSFRVAGLLILFFSGVLEINHQFYHYFPSTGINIQYILLYIYSFVLVLLMVSQQFHSIRIQVPITFLLLIFTLGFYLLSIAGNFDLLKKMMDEKKNGIHFTAHWVAAILLLIIYYQLIKFIRKNYENNLNVASWLLSGWLVIFLSAELFLMDYAINYNGSNNWESVGNVFIKSGLPILWGICSFAFMWLGMRYKYRTLRIISLSLFAITLIKLFAYDISNIPVGGKIAAFFCLGVLLLIVSFMYQRLKRIIIEDEKKPE